MSPNRGILILANAREVVRAEKLLRTHHIEVRVIPIPEPYSSECGMALEIEPLHVTSVIQLLEQGAISFQMI